MGERHSSYQGQAQARHVVSEQRECVSLGVGWPGLGFWVPDFPAEHAYIGTCDKVINRARQGHDNAQGRLVTKYLEVRLL